MTTQTLTEELFARGALMGLHIGRWTAVKKMSANDMLMKEVDTDAIYLGHKKLLPKKATEKLVELEGKARVALSSRSMEFPIAGARFVTYSAMAGIVSHLQQIKVQWEQEVNELATQYPALRATQLALLETQARAFTNEELKKVPYGTDEYKSKHAELEVWMKNQKALNEGYYPTEQQLRAKFSFTWRLFQISALTGINELDAAEVAAAQDRLRADLNEWVRAAAASMHQTLGEAAANAKNLLEKNGKLTPRNLKPLFESFESFLSVDFTGKSTFRDTIETIKSKFLNKNPDGTYNLEAMADGLDDVHSKAEFDGLLSRMSTLAVESTAAEAGVSSLQEEFGRVLDL